jgi:Zn-dependent peptidase ImmA (M78 family)
MSSKYKATAMATTDIRSIAKMFRKCCGLQGCEWVPVITILEKIMGKIYPGFEWSIAYENEMSEEGKTYPGANEIRIRQDVYVAACKGDGRARFTVMHEIGHFILHSTHRIALCRLENGERLPPYEDPEWQANTFAAECLMDVDVIRGMDFLQISNVCGVSWSAAQTRVNKLKGGRKCN